MLRHSAFFFVVCFSVALPGCGPDTGGRVGVSGTVTYQGQPLEDGTIQFVSVDGSQMAGATISEGVYSIPAERGLLPGQMTVRVSSAGESAAAPADAGPAGDPAIDGLSKEMIPAEYNTRSTLTTEISSDGPNTFDVHIP